MKSKLLTAARWFLAVPFALVTLVLLIVTAFTMLWWELIGLILRLVPGRARRFLGRWLGAFLFSWALVATLFCAALTAWAIHGKSFWPRFSALCESSIAGLEEIPRLRDMGGFW